MKTLIMFLIISTCAIIAQAHLDTAKSYLGVTELTGKNDGVEVEKFLKSVGRKKGDSWCGAFVSYCLTASGSKYPVRSGLARDFKNKAKKGLVIDANKVLRGEAEIEKGYLVGWEKGNTIFGHIGIVTEKWIGKNGKTIEGNTSSGVKGSQFNGDGVYERKREIQPSNYFRVRWFVIIQGE